MTALKTKKILIQGEAFEVSTPYDEGHTLTAIEARVLNQTRLENIRNNMAKAVKEAKENGTLSDMAGKVAEYDAQYVFTTPGSGSGRSIDPVEREARKIARDVIRSKLAEQGRAFSEFQDKENPERHAELQGKLNAAIDTVAAKDEVLKAAKKNVEAKKKQTKSLVEDVEI